jgi:hypothetical protein
MQDFQIKIEIQKFGSLEHIEVFKVLRTSCWSFVLLLVKRQSYETFSLLDFDFFQILPATLNQDRTGGRDVAHDKILTFARESSLHF